MCQSPTPQHQQPLPAPGAGDATGDEFAPTEAVVIQPDSDDADSLASDDTASSYSTSIGSTVVNYTYANGRRYHAFRAGAYVLPNDETEQDRLDLLHHIWRLMIGGKLFRAPISEHPQSVLDFGTGTGIWAIDFADEFTSAVVTGTDLSPIQPTWIPPNVKFYVDDCESDWTYGSEPTFEYIHGRAMSGSIKDWDLLLRRAYDNLKPGGWLELQEYEAEVATDDDSRDRAPNLIQFQELIGKASREFGKDLAEAEKLKGRLQAAGFEDVHDDVYKVPIGTWPKDRTLKNLGMYELEQIVSAIEPFCFGFLGKIMQWSEEECRVFNAKVTKELRDKRNHFYVKFHFIYGTKTET